MKKKITTKDLGRSCLIKTIQLFKTTEQPFDQYIWTIIGFKTIKKEQHVELMCSWTNDNIWRVKSKDIILHDE